MMADLFIRLDDDIKHELKLLAARESRTIKEIIIDQIENYIKVHKEGNPQHLMTQFLNNEDFTGFPAIAIEYNKKQSYQSKNCISDNRLNEFGNQLWGHVTQWYHLMSNL